VLAVALVILLLAIPKIKSLSEDKKIINPMANGGGLPVSFYVVTPEKLSNRILTTGTILANEEVELKSETAGRVTEVHFEEGSRVQQGALMIKINDAELQAELLKAQYRKELAADKERRGLEQLKIEAISQQDYDVILNELNREQAEIQLIRAQIAKTEIKAPFEGMVGLRYISKGSYIPQNTRIANFLDINPVKIDFAVPERYVNMVKVGNSIAFKIQGYEEEFEGKVYAIEPRIDAATRTLQLRAQSPNPEGDILPGAFADIRLVLEEINDATMVPSEALVPELNGQKVFLFKGGKAMPQRVEIGTRSETKVQIVSGIANGDTVITSGILQLRPGAAVALSGTN
jgi:membrane fusion protein (multidrug efflux system)